MALNKNVVTRAAQALTDEAVKAGTMSPAMRDLINTQVRAARIPPDYRYPSMCLSYRGMVHWEDNREAPRSWARFCDLPAERPLFPLDGLVGSGEAQETAEGVEDEEKDSPVSAGAATRPPAGGAAHG